MNLALSPNKYYISRNTYRYTLKALVRVYNLLEHIFSWAYNIQWIKITKKNLSKLFITQMLPFELQVRGLLQILLEKATLSIYMVIGIGWALTIIQSSQAVWRLKKGICLIFPYESIYYVKPLFMYKYILDETNVRIVGTVSMKFPLVMPNLIWTKNTIAKDTVMNIPEITLYYQI